MKTIGIIGGTSWFSTIDYYRELNVLVNQRLGGNHAAKLILYSVDFYDFKQLVDQANWDAVGLMFSEIALNLQHAGADFIIIASNTPHTIADVVKRRIGIPLLHIADVTGNALLKDKIAKVALIGTLPTMEGTFFTDRLLNLGIQTIVPDSKDRQLISNIVFSELTQGIFNPESREKLLVIIEGLAQKGA